MGERAIDRLPVEIWREIFDKLLTIDFRFPLLQPSVPWSRRKREFDIWVRYSEMLKNRERLRLVTEKWRAIVETYPWCRLDLERFYGPPPGHHRGDVLWAVYPFGRGYQSRDRVEDVVQSASTIVVLTLTWRAESSLTKLYCLFAHTSSFRRLQKLIVDFTFRDRTSNDLATHTFFSNINAFSSTLITLSLNVNLYDPRWFESRPVLRLTNLLHLDLRFGGLLGALNTSEWNCPKLTHLKLTGAIEGTNYISHLSSMSASLQFLTLQRRTGGESIIHLGSLFLHFGNAFWRAFPSLEVLSVDWASRSGSHLSNPPLSHPIREFIVQSSTVNRQYEIMAELFQEITASNDSLERKRKVILEDVNWNSQGDASLKWELIKTHAGLARWLEDEGGVSLMLATQPSLSLT